MRIERSPVATVPSRRAQKRRGFTLLELLLVLAILVVLGGIVGVNLVGTQAAAYVDATKAQMTEVKSSIKLFQIRMNGLPETLEALRDGPSDSAQKAKWVDSIMDEIPKDAWGRDFVYSVNGNKYEIRSAGIDGQMNTDDDIVEEG